MITVEVDPRALIQVLTGLERQLPYAASVALNRSTLAAQTGLRQAMRRSLVLRTPLSAAFFDRMIKFPARSTKRNLQTQIIVIGPEEDPRRAELLTRHITGSTAQKPGTALQSLFIPADVLRPTPATVVPRAMYPRALRLMDRMAPSGMLYAKRRGNLSINKRGELRGSIQLIGKQRTFVLTERGTHGLGRAFGVYQREGREIQLIWLYTQRIVNPKRFDFYGVGQREFLKAWPIEFRAAWAQAVATARPSA